MRQDSGRIQKHHSREASEQPAPARRVVERVQVDEHMMDPFVHLPEHSLVICQRCKVALTAGEVSAHIRKRHGDINRDHARRIGHLVQSIPGVIQDQAGMDQWSPGSPDIEPIPYIEAPVHDGLGCNECRYVVRDVRQMQKHCRTKHGWVNDWAKGGDVVRRARQQRPPMPWRVGVSCQKLSNWGHGKRWFEVRQPESDRTSRQRAEDDGLDEVAEFFNRIHDDDDEAFESEAKAKVQSIDDKWEAQTWLRRCGWARHLEGISRDRLRQLTRPIGEDEAVLQRMWDILERVLNGAYFAAGQCHAGTAELFEIERKEVHVTTTMPFQGLMEADAWARYKAWWKTLLSIWKRMESWDGGEADADVAQEERSSDGEGSTDVSVKEEDAETGTAERGDDRRPPYRMTTAQEKSWRRFDEGVTEAVQGHDAEARRSDAQLERCCLDTVVQFFDHPFKSGNHYESIIISALAVMGLEEDGGWMPVTNYTPIYSAVIKVARYLVLYQSIIEREAYIRTREAGMGVDRRTAEEAAPGLFRIVRRKVRRFMTRISEDEDAEPTPMNWIINTRTYGLRIRYTTPGSETIDWRGDQIVHGRVKLRMGELSDMLHSLVAEARRTLAQLTMTNREDEEEEEQRDYAHQAAMQDLLPRIPWSKIEDQHGESGLEHSFLRHEENEWWTEPGRGWVKNRILASAARRKAWLAEPLDERCPYREQAVREYERTIERFRAQMFVGMHTLGGQPARSTEILGLRMWNTANAGVRNIFMHEGMVCFVTMYHKGFRRTGNTKIIHRYLPREVGELLVWYMWLVLPFWQKVQGRIKQKWRRSAFLWADEVVGVEGGKEDRRRGSRGAPAAVTDEDDREERDEKEEEAAFMEWFRERKWTSDRARREMQRYSAQFSGQELNISAWRQVAIGISNRYFNKVFGADDGGDGELDEDGDGSLVDSIHDLQAGHGSHVAGLIYARLFGQGELGTMRSREQFRKVSMQWHRFSGFGAEDRTERGCGAGGGGGGKRARAVFDVEREESQRKRFERLHRIDIRGQLKQMMGPTAEFRGMQETAIRAVTRGEWPIIQVTPTGGGKSLTFMLPAFCTPDGVTVVVTPLTSLQHDMVDRCVKSGISAYRWESRGAQRAASLVFVTPESAVSKGFRTFVERMHSQHKMDRVVVDECHTTLQHTSKFRPQMGLLGQTLRDFAVPVVCLTATLKPTQEAALIEKLEFVRDRVRIIREPTTRSNIQYRVDIVEDGAREAMNVGRRRGGARVRLNGSGEEMGERDDAVTDRVCEIVRAWTKTHERGKVIVYGGTIERVKQIAAELGCQAYWRGAGDEEEKARRLAEWRRIEGGEAGWIAATNALGMGIDDPKVGMVVHAGMPRKLVDFVQESGRGGRDGRRSESVVVVRRSWLEQQCEGRKTQRRRTEEADWAWEEDAVEFTEGRCCRREVLDREMDGRTDRFGCVEGEEACDVCQGQQMARDLTELAETDGVGPDEEEEMVGAAVEADYQRMRQSIQQVEAERTSQVMEEAREVGEFEDLLAEWAGCCAVCKLEDSVEVGHEMEDCPKKDGPTWVHMQQGTRAVWEEMMGRRRFALYSACFGCGLPQRICVGWEAASEDGRLFRKTGKKCQYGGVLFRIFVAQRVRAREWWTGTIGRMTKTEVEEVEDHEQMGKLYEWMGELVEWGGRAGAMQASRLCQAVTRLEREWKGRR